MFDDDKVTVAGLTDTEQTELNMLRAQLRAKLPRNALRAAYYDGKNAVHSIGISTPPSMARLLWVLGWSAKAVDVLNRRCKLEGLVVPGKKPDDLAGIGLTDLWDANQLDLEAPQAGVSSLIHAASFLITTMGDTRAGEPPVLITTRDAMTGTGRWDTRRRGLSSFLSLTDTDDEGKATDLVLYLPGQVITITRRDGRWETVGKVAHRYGVPVEPLVYRPRLGRPFGSSRISRAVMSLHDSAIRTVIRSEVTAELYSVPQRILLGADESAFTNADGTVKTAWQAILGRVWGIPDDPDSDNPRADVKEFKAAAQTPHVDQLRAWAQLFAGETSIPLASLGISGEANPTSEGAYQAGREDLIAEAEGTTDGWSPAWRRTTLRALSMLNGWAEVPDEFKGLRPKWRSPSLPSRAAAADAAGKMFDRLPWLADTSVGLELYGLDADQVERALAERPAEGPADPDA